MAKVVSGLPDGGVTWSRTLMVSLIDEWKARW